VTKKPTLLIFILLLLSILAIPLTVADAEQYLTLGNTRTNAYYENTEGIWDTQTPIQYPRTYNKIQTYTPLVADVDNDTQQEIIIIADDNLIILNFTRGTGLIEESSITHGNTSLQTRDYQITPYIIDYDSDDYNEIITFNWTHFITIGYNGTAYNIDQTQTTGLGTIPPSLPTNTKPVIKCAPGNNWATNNATCIVFINNRTVTSDLVSCAYDINANTVTCKKVLSAPNQDLAFHNTHLADTDGNGYVEAYIAYKDAPNGDQEVWVTELSSAFTLTNSQVYDHALASNRQFNDISIIDIDANAGNGLEIVWYYQSGAQPDYEAIAITRTGTLIDNSFFLNNPEGDLLSANTFQVESNVRSVFTYLTAVQSPGACAYITDHTNDDKIVCVSRYTGSGSVINTVTNANNHTTSPLVHTADLTSNDGISVLTPLSLVDSVVYMNIVGADTIIPVDAEKTGLSDLISLSTSTIKYYDDAYTNLNTDITRRVIDPKSPMCQYETATITLTVYDKEGDTGTCLLEEYYQNGTLVSSPSNATFQFLNDANSTSVNLYYYGDVVGTRTLKVRCKDQYHSSYDSESKVYSISNNTDVCNLPGGDVDDTEFQTSTDDLEDSEFDDDVDELLDGLGIASKSARNIIAIIAVFLIAILVFVKSNSIMLAVCSIPATLIVAFLLGLVSIFPLVVLILFSVAVLTYLFMTGRGEV